MNHLSNKFENIERQNESLSILKLFLNIIFILGFLIYLSYVGEFSTIYRLKILDISRAVVIEESKKLTQSFVI